MSRLDIEPRTLPSLLDRAAAEHGDRTAIDFLGKRWTYSEVHHLVDRVAHGLQMNGVTPGARVGLCLPNSPYFVIFYFAILRIGGIVVNFNPLYVERELRHQIIDSGTQVMITLDLQAIYSKVAAVADETGLRKIVVCPMMSILPPLKALGFCVFKRKEIARFPADDRHVSFSSLIAHNVVSRHVPVSPDDLAVLQYTGGTTGVPKGAMLTHASLAANSAQMVVHVGGRRHVQERTLGVLPLFHVFALTTVLNFSVDIAAEMILLPRFEMKAFLATIRRTRPTQFFGVPTLFGAMNALDPKNTPDLSSIEICISGGAPLPLEMRAAFEARYGIRVVEGYGLSEASPIVACNPLRGLVKDNSAGKAFPGTVIEIRCLDDRDHIQSLGDRGEVCIRGPQLMRGYWQRDADTLETFIDGALRTGDVGYLDDEGYLFLVDRIKDMILCGGYNVYPRVIEDALYEHSAVAEAVVIGVTDPYRGQSPKAFVALHPDHETSPAELKAFLAKRISKIEMPSAIVVRESLPKTLVGKLSKKALIEEEAAAASSPD